MGSSRGGEVMETYISELLPNALTQAKLEGRDNDEEEDEKYS
ncbi:unnamed protein product [Strongylus vulgaris]|uniref:Uncharacterized protein n=1 Tax=Strongylus vulgaris TaxID=40348 RepID=A0A3P7JFH0_STRVU|nr:unnamed protein product [Strongylus vulgaris]